MSLISDLPEIRSSPEGKVNNRTSHEASNRYFPDTEVSIIGNLVNLELSNCCTNNKKKTHKGHKRKASAMIILLAVGKICG